MGRSRTRTVELRVYFRIQGLCLNSGYVLGVPAIRTIVFHNGFPLSGDNHDRVMIITAPYTPNLNP